MKALRGFAGVTILCAQLLMSHAHAAPDCMTRAGLAAFLVKELPAAKAVVLEARDASVLLVALARATGSAPPTADALVIIDPLPQSAVLKIVLFKGDCAVQVGTFDRRTVTRALNDVSRAGA